MRSVLLGWFLCGVVSGCLLEPARTRSSAGWTISYTRPPIVDVTTPVLLDRASGELDGLTAQPELSLGRARSSFRSRSTFSGLPAEAVPLGLPVPTVAAPVLAAPVCPPAVPIAVSAPPLASPPPVVRESVISPAALQQLLDRLSAIEAKLATK